MLVHLDERKADELNPMKNCLHALFILSVIAFLSFETFGQSTPRLPGNLNQHSTVSEILTWLDQTTFRNARVVLKDSSPSIDYGRLGAAKQNGRGQGAGTLIATLRIRRRCVCLVHGAPSSVTTAGSPEPWLD